MCAMSELQSSRVEAALARRIEATNHAAAGGGAGNSPRSTDTGQEKIQLYPMLIKPCELRAVSHSDPVFRIARAIATISGLSQRNTS